MFKKEKTEKDTPKDGKVPKKLKEFYEGKNSLKKFKALTSYCDSQPSADEIKSFFEKEAYNVWSVFLDTFQHYEQQSSKSKKLEVDIEKLLQILKRILIYLSPKIKEKWQIRSISNIVERVLYKDNHHQIRLLGLELLLLFLSDLEVPDPPQTNILACAIDMEIFLPAYANKKIILPNKVPVATETSLALYPASANPTIEDSVAMFDAFLEFMGIHPESFDLMWGLFKKHYLVVLYPDLAKSLSLLDKFSDIGFPGHCPYEIQVMFITKLSGLLNLEQVMKAMWSSKENVAILLEIYRQSCLLPMEHVEAIKNSINLFRRMLLGSKKDPIPKLISETENLLSLQQFFIEQLPNVFITETKPQTAEQQVTLCLEIFQMFKQTFERNEVLSTEIRDVLLFTLLEVSKTLLKSDNPNQDLAKSLASVTVDTLLFTWITSKIMDAEMWARLQEGIQLLFHRIEPITQSKLKLIQMSLIIRDFIYPPVQKKKSNKPTTSANKEKLSPAVTPDYRKIMVPANDTSLTALNWNFETAYFVWEALLNVFRNVNRIKDPALHSEAMSCLLEVMDIFLSAESKAPFKQIADSAQPPISLVSKLGKLFFEACYLDDKFLQGKSKAFAALCRLVCRNLKALPGLFPESLLPHFYSAIHHALCNPAHDNDILSCTLIDNSYNIFNLALEGASILIPYYLIEIKRLLTSNHPPPAETRKRALILVGSLLCYPSHFGDLDIPVKVFGHLQRQKTKEVWDIDDKITFTQLREFLASLLSLILRTDDNIEIKCMALWDLYVLIVDCVHYHPNADFLKGILKDIFNYTLAPDHIGVTALDVLTALSQITKVSEVDTTLFPLMVDGICSSAEIGLADKQREVDDKGIQHHFFTLTEIVLAVPSLLDDAEIVTKIFNCAQNAIRNAERSRDSAASVSSATPQASKDPRKTPKSRRETDQPTSNPVVSQKITTTKDAARCLIATLMAFHKTFPTIPGAEFGCAILNENDDGGPVDPHEITHWIYASDALLSFVEIEGKNGKTARLFMRGSLGKFVWNFNLNTASSQYQPEAESIVPFTDPQKAPESVLPTAYDPRPGARQQKNRQPGTITLFNMNNLAENDGNIDKVDELLQYLGEVHSDLILTGQKTLNQPTLLPKKYLQQILTLQNSIKNQTQDDSKVMEDKQKSTGKVLSVLPPKEVSPIHKYHNCRMLLSQLGMMHPSNLQEYIQPIDNNKAFQLRLRNLDKTYNRDTMKVGLLYVAPGQETQDAILENDANVKPPSSLYAEFASGLGWNIDLATHKGYNGGLDPGSANHGKVALYYCNSTMELVYHEVLKLPTIENDPHKQLHKKRHVGNDVVHIVWSEHGRDYSTKTISGQFNDAHIIIYPCANGLFRIQIAKKDFKVPPFGPLVHGMAVPKRLLPLLVRQTAINAHRYIRLGTEGYDKPYFTRYSLIQEIISKAAVKPNYEEFVLSVIKPESKVKATPVSTPVQSQTNSPQTLPKMGSGQHANEEECLANS